MSMLKETELQIEGISDINVQLSIPRTKGLLSLGGGITYLYIKNLKTGQKTTLAGSFSSIGLGKSLGGSKFVSLSGSLPIFPSDGSHVFEGSNRKHKLRPINLTSWPVMIITGNIGSLTGG